MHSKLCGETTTRRLQVEGGHRPPLDRNYPFYVVFEIEGSQPQLDEQQFMTVLERGMAEGHIVDAAIPKSEAEMAEIWEIRENFEKLYEQEPVVPL